MIPYSVAIITMPVMSLASDRFQRKAVPTLICLSVSVVGYIMLIASVRKPVLIIGCCFVAAGSYPAVVISVSWLLSNHAGYTKKSTAWAVTQVFIQCYSIISTQIYTNPPRFIKGHSILLALNALGVVAGSIKYYVMKRENKRRDQVAQALLDEGRVDPASEQSLEELCDYHPDFRYVL
jgi:MFS family permease